MTNSHFVVADSGGNGTGWAIHSEDGTCKYIKTVSLHPKFTTSWSVFEWEKLKAELAPLTGTKLYFYGAGCGQESVQHEMAKKMQQLGFSEPEVFPDTLGACRAVSAGNPGTVAILGTGSVVLGFNGREIETRFGGYGSLIGDEGGGMHFAKLLLCDYLDGHLKEDEFAQVIGTRKEVMARLADASVQTWMARLSEITASLNMQVIHRLNIETFLKRYVLPNYPKGTVLHVVGSYGFYQWELLRNTLIQNGLVPGNCVADPIESLVRYHVR